MPPSTLAQIRAHAVKCRTNGCPCKKYVANRNQWAQHFTILDDGPQSDDGAQSTHTWLWHNIDAHGKVSITCVVCGMKLPCHFASLRRHHRSASHLKSLATFLGKPLQDVAFTAPLVKSFKRMFSAFHQGRAARSGFDVETDSGVAPADRKSLLLEGLELVDGKIVDPPSREAVYTWSLNEGSYSSFGSSSVYDLDVVYATKGIKQQNIAHAGGAAVRLISARYLTHTTGCVRTLAVIGRTFQAIIYVEWRK